MFVNCPLPPRHNCILTHVYLGAIAVRRETHQHHRESRLTWCVYLATGLRARRRHFPGIRRPLVLLGYAALEDVLRPRLSPLPDSKLREYCYRS